MGSEKKLFVAMPVYRVMDVLTAQCLIKLSVEQLVKGEFSMALKMHVGECPIGRARNDLTSEFLASDCTHILFIDSDIVFGYEQVKKILNSGQDIVGGFYTMKAEGPVHPVCNVLNTVAQPGPDGLLEVKYMGTGFLCVSRKVFETMIEKLGNDLAYVDDRSKTVKHDFWRMGVATDVVTGVKRWLSEDWQFCQFAIECGFKVWADASILLRHSGQAIYPLSYQLKQLYTDEQLKNLESSVGAEIAHTDNGGGDGLPTVAPA